MNGNTDEATGFAFDVFVSYAKADKDSARELAERLESDGLRIWFDDWRIAPGDSIPLAIMQGLTQSRILVLLMSTAGLQSDWVTLEANTAIFRDPTNRQRRFIPVKLEDCDVTDTMRHLAFVDWTNRSPTEYQRLVEACGTECDRPSSSLKPLSMPRRIGKPEGPSVPLETEGSPPAGHRDVTISCPLVALQDARRHVWDACLRLGLTPLDAQDSAMSAGGSDSRLSARETENAGFFVGLYPGSAAEELKAGERQRLTEEYASAKKAGRPRLLFRVTDAKHDLPGNEEPDTEASALIRHLSADDHLSTITSLTQLRYEAIAALARHIAAAESQNETPSVAPERSANGGPCIVHPYTLLQTTTGRIIGRDSELRQLDDWLSDDQGARTMSIVAVGGEGKSALAWEWVLHRLPRHICEPRPVFWWSFYETHATFERFVLKSLEYLDGNADHASVSLADRLTRLLKLLDQTPAVFVLDGLERIMLAYSDCDHPMPEIGLNGQSNRRPHRQDALARRFTSHQTTQFFKRIATATRSRFLITTRLLPGDWRSLNGKPLPGCAVVDLKGLSDADAIAFARSFGIVGDESSMIEFFHKFGNHSLLLQLVVHQICECRSAPGNFKLWLARNPEFSPFDLPVAQCRHHILEQALRGLSPLERSTLDTLGLLRQSVSYFLLESVILRKHGDAPERSTVLAGFDNALASLESRGLLGWDRQSNRYDLHPIVRGVVVHSLSPPSKQSVLGDIEEHFRLIPSPPTETTSLDELADSIELVRVLIEAERCGEAIDLYNSRLYTNLHYNIGAYNTIVRLLQPFSKVGLSSLDTSQKGVLFVSYTHALVMVGDLEDALEFAASVNESEIVDPVNDAFYMMTSCCKALLGLGQIKAAGKLSDSLYDCAKKAGSFKSTGDACWEIVRGNLVKGDYTEVEPLLSESKKAWDAYAVARGGFDPDFAYECDDVPPYMWPGNDNEWDVHNAVFRAQMDLSRGDIASAEAGLRVAVGVAAGLPVRSCRLPAQRLLAIAQLRSGKTDEADELLARTLELARTSHRFEEEIRCLLAIAELQSLQGDIDNARELVDYVILESEARNNVLLTADAYYRRAILENQLGDQEASGESAKQSYRHAWCDGPPHSYKMTLAAAAAHLKELGQPLPKVTCLRHQLTSSTVELFL